MKSLKPLKPYIQKTKVLANDYSTKKITQTKKRETKKPWGLVPGGIMWGHVLDFGFRISMKRQKNHACKILFKLCYFNPIVWGYHKIRFRIIQENWFGITCLFRILKHINIVLYIVFVRDNFTERISSFCDISFFNL